MQRETLQRWTNWTSKESEHLPFPFIEEKLLIVYLGTNFFSLFYWDDLIEGEEEKEQERAVNQRLFFKGDTGTT